MAAVSCQAYKGIMELSIKAFTNGDVSPFLLLSLFIALSFSLRGIPSLASLYGNEYKVKPPPKLWNPNPVSWIQDQQQPINNKR